MNEIKVFENAAFGRIRTVEINGEPWFVAADVCRALEIGNPSQALTRLEEDEKRPLSFQMRVLQVENPAWHLSMKSDCTRLRRMCAGCSGLNK